MANQLKKPPFAIDRTRRGDLVEQLTSALRRSIQTGYYKSDDILPPTRELSSLLNVSRVVAVRAIKRLAEEGMVNPRPHVGCVVCAPNRPPWKDQVLIVVPPGIGNPSGNAVYSVLRDALAANGYLPFVATVPRSPTGKFDDFAFLDTMLCQQTALVVQLHNQDTVTRWLSQRKVPFIRFDANCNRASQGCVGVVKRSYDTVLADFVDHCRSEKVSEVLQVKAFPHAIDVAYSLKRIGVHVSTWQVPLPEASCTAFGLKKWAAEAFAARLEREGRGWLKDLVFFQDDHLTDGALLALESAGLRIPHDVRIVTWANRDYGPVSLVPLTRMEMDVISNGEKLVDCVLNYLRTDKFPAHATVGPTYIKGKSF